MHKMHKFCEYYSVFNHRMTWNHDWIQSWTTWKRPYVKKKFEKFFIFFMDILLVCTWRHGGHVGGQEQKHFSPLGTKLYFHVNSSRKYSFVLTPNMAALSRGCKPRIHPRFTVHSLQDHLKIVFFAVYLDFISWNPNLNMLPLYFLKNVLFRSNHIVTCLFLQVMALASYGGIWGREDSVYRCLPLSNWEQDENLPVETNQRHNVHWCQHFLCKDIPTVHYSPSRLFHGHSAKPGTAQQVFEWGG